MTLKERLMKMGEENGLNSQESAQIVNVLSAEDNHKLARLLNDKADAYPQQMIEALWSAFRRVAALWLAENKPDHWARLLFSARGLARLTFSS